MAGYTQGGGHGHTVKAEAFPAFPESLFRAIRRPCGKIPARPETVKEGGFGLVFELTAVGLIVVPRTRGVKDIKMVFWVVVQDCMDIPVTPYPIIYQVSHLRVFESFLHGSFSSCYAPENRGGVLNSALFKHFFVSFFGVP